MLGESHQEVEHRVGALARQLGRVAAGGCERGLDPFLAHLLRDVFASVLEKARGVGPRGALRLALADRYLDHEK